MANKKARIPTVQIMVRMKPNLIESLDSIASELRTTNSDVIRGLIFQCAKDAATMKKLKKFINDLSNEG